MRYGLIGEKLGHSFSKEIHEMLCPGHAYGLLELSPDGLGDFFRRRGFDGLNVTIPYKRAVMPLLDEVSPEALAIGAVNTVVNRGGRLTGYNTDYFGFTALARKAGIGFKGRKVLILGAGGAAATVRAAALDLGAREVVNAVRHPRLETDIPLGEAAQKAADARIIVNCTPVGMYPGNDGRILGLSSFGSLEGVLDCIYNPLDTNLILDAQEKGVKAEGGLYMLVAQACRAAELFHPGTDAGALLDGVYSRLLESKRNMVLCGMPSCGKSTIGRLLSEAYGRDFIDTDSLVEARAGKPAGEIIRSEGEAAFRALEGEVIAEVSRRQGLVISTGGGAVMDPANVRRLRSNGLLYFIKRSPEALMATPDRPLSSSREALEALYSKRLPVYESVADAVFDNDEPLCEADFKLCWERKTRYL